ncbi:MAG: hypothetical protein A3J74_07450 [Elusimicrobia bacterium RIFCSPHIGHO2_02_FULL_57_9]|nr:MAG: hypothetical protein A3J74_07450 [Elusimicrobia bacterium RIFCSPHIGHO2_02_FULL_57_9]
MTHDKDGVRHAHDPFTSFKPASSWRLIISRLSSRFAAIFIAFASVVFLGVMYLVLREAGSFSRRKIDFPARPQLDAAISSAAERLKVNPQDISTLVEMGTLHFEKGKDFYADAINELEEARELGALDPRIFYCLGVMYQEVGLYSFALDEYRRFLRHYPDDKEIRMLAAKLLYRQGDYQQAVSEYERLKFHFPNESLIEENLGLSLWGAARAADPKAADPKATDRAVESFNQLKTMGNEPAKRAEFYLGKIAYENSQYERAMEHFKKFELQEMDFGIPGETINAALGSTYQKLGRWEQARAFWELVLKDIPTDEKASAALREIKRRLPRKKIESKTS